MTEPHFVESTPLGPHEPDLIRKSPGSGEPPKSPTPFDQPLRSCGDVLHAHVPAVQEATFLIQRALGSGPGSFRAERMMKYAGKIFTEFRVALKMLELAQAKMAHESRRTAPRKSRRKLHERTAHDADRTLSAQPGSAIRPAAPETAPHADGRETAPLAGAPVDRAPQAAPPVAQRDAKIRAVD